jgi:hypothetical protein
MGQTLGHYLFSTYEMLEYKLQRLLAYDRF